MTTRKSVEEWAGLTKPEALAVRILEKRLPKVARQRYLDYFNREVCNYESIEQIGDMRLMDLPEKSLSAIEKLKTALTLLFYSIPLGIVEFTLAVHKDKSITGDERQSFARMFTALGYLVCQET